VYEEELSLDSFTPEDDVSVGKDSQEAENRTKDYFLLL
jgi:hypothetical protein